MYSFSIKIADLTVGISCAHEQTLRMCAEYLVNDVSPMFSVEVNETDKEKLRKFFLGFSEVFSEDYIENCAIFDKLCSNVFRYDAAVFHAALISFKGEGVAFAAPSGTGKTTHINLWKKMFGDDVEIINGDKPLFSLRDGAFYASGMPWCGKESFNINKTVPLKAICFLERSQDNSLERLNDSGEIMRRLFSQLVMPENTPEFLSKYLSFANALIKTVPFYILRCNMSDDAAVTAHNGLFGE